MKKTVVLLIFILAAFHLVYGGENAYYDNMMQAKNMADSATVEESLVIAANYFERIAAMNPDKWLPHYYASWCYARISHLIKDARIKDEWVDKAQSEIDKAFLLERDNAEILVLKGFVLQARMNIDPSVRGFQYNGEVMGYFSKARGIDPENPRSYLWQGVNLMHTPANYGGGMENACPLIRKALEKFGTFVPVDSLAPNWGSSYAKDMMEKCK